MQAMVRYTANVLIGMISVSCLAFQVRAEVNSDRPASIIVFPNVVADGTRDTIIQLTNSANFMAAIRCFYANALDSVVTDFSVSLTAQQPTHWVVSGGRTSSDPTPGLSPGLIPPAPAFAGELLCVAVDASGYPIATNALTGEATIKDLQSGDVAKYNPIGLLGNVDYWPPDGTTLSLDGSAYDACPASWVLDHLAYGAEDQQIGTGSAVRTRLTFVPCTQDFTTSAPQSVIVQFRLTNEFEQRLSAARSVTGWADLSLSDISTIFTPANAGSVYLQTEMSSSFGGGGFLVVAQEFRDTPDAVPVTASATVNAHPVGTHATPDVIILTPPL
jgi:hypothetical protein